MDLQGEFRGEMARVALVCVAVSNNRQKIEAEVRKQVKRNKRDLSQCQKGPTSTSFPCSQQAKD